MSAEPIELVAKTTGKVVGFVCGKCSGTTMMMFPGSYLGTDEERLEGARGAAMDHCGPWLCACGSERECYWKICKRCHYAELAKGSAAKERSAFEIAEKVPAAEWGGEYVWSERFQRIYGDIRDLLDRYDAEDEEPPEYVWECEEVRFCLNARDILDSEAEGQEACEGFREGISWADEEELQDLLDGWLEKKELRWWREENGRAVILRGDDASE